MRRAACVLALASSASAAACGGEPPAGNVPWPGDARSALVRPDTPGNNLMFNFDPADVVETYGTPVGEFLVHFTRQGKNGVPAADADTSGVPDFVEEVAAVYDEVLAFYEGELGFRRPLPDDAIADNGGDGRFDVYLVDFGGVGDGHYSNDQCEPTNPERCAGYMVQENDYVGYGYPSTLYANRVLGSHELFHAVQAAYDNEQGTIAAEGTAVWATEQFDPTLNDFEGFSDGYLKNVDRSLDVPLPGPVDPFSYGSAVFFQFVEERYGPGVVLALWERCENDSDGVADPDWYEDALEATLEAEASTAFSEAFVEFARWNLYTGSLADPAMAYDDAGGYSKVKMESVTMPYSDDEIRVFHASAQYFSAKPEGRAAVTAALVPPSDDPGAAEGLALMLVAEIGDGWGEVLAVADPVAGAETVASSIADRVVAVVVNGALLGESKKPGLCFGSPEEVTACKLQLGGGAGGAGGAGGSGPGGGGGAAASTPASEQAEDGGCGCRAGASGLGNASGLAGGLVLAALAWARRRRSGQPPQDA